MTAIVQTGDPVLRKKAKDVPEKMFGSPELRTIIADMKKALASQEDGVALAAPQIGIPLRIFVVARRVFEMPADPRAPKKEKASLQETSRALETDVSQPLVYINPVLVKVSRTKRSMDEGCLSVRGYYGKVRRAEKASVEALDEHGRRFSRGGSGLLAQIFQHETDHLNGILFTDKTDDLYYMAPEKEPLTRRRHE